jgi:hypothetical protein
MLSPGPKNPPADDSPPTPSRPAWRIETREDPPSVVAIFDGWLTKEAGEASALAFRDTIAATKRQVVWDVQKMTGYDTGARLAWQEVLWPVRRNILKLEVVGAKGIVRVGAISLAIVLGVPWKMT